MTVATRAIFTGGAAAPDVPVADYTAAPEGGINPWAIPGALQYGGKTFVGYVDGQSGDIDAFAVDTAGTVSGPYTVESAYQADAHTSPALLRRVSDGRLIILYAKHAPDQQDVQVRVSTNPDDVSSWGSATNIHSQLGGDEYADYQLWEYDGTLYLFFRHELNGVQDSYWSLSTTSASTPTSGWSTKSTVFRIAGTRSYVITRLDPNNGILYFATTSSASGGYTDMGAFYYDLASETYHTSDGTDITSSVPLGFADITTVYEGTSLVFPNNIAIGLDGYPVISGWDTISSSFRYLWHRWNGSSWDTANVASGNDGYQYNEGGSYQHYGSQVDDRDVNRLWVIEEVSGQPEVATYYTRDNGTTWERRTVTSTSSGLVVQLIAVRDPHRTLRVLWHEGTWTDYDDYSLALSGAGF